MTHERNPEDELEGPENDLSLPDATTIPEADGPFDLPPNLPVVFFPLPSVAELD